MKLVISIFLAVGVVALAHAFGTAGRDSQAADALDAAYEDCMAAYEAGEWDKAYAHFLELARAGHVGAQAMMGLIYYHGQGVAQNHVAAAIWLYQAAQRGYGAAQLALGTLFREGEGVAADPARAYAWYALAALRGSDSVRAEARRLMANMAAEMSQDEIAAAQDWVANWRPAYGLPAASTLLAGN